VFDDIPFFYNYTPDFANTHLEVTAASAMNVNSLTPMVLGNLDMGADLTLSGAPSVSFNEISAADGTTLAGNLIEVRGTLAVGDGIGSATIEADLAMADGSTLAAEFSGDTSDSLALTGALDLTSGSDTLALDWLADGVSSPFGGTYRVASYQGSLAGNQFDLIGGNLDDYVDEILYDVDDDPADPNNPLGLDVTLFDLLVGDINLDGQVSIADLAIMGNAANWGTNDGSATWFTGDLNFDGNVSIADLAILGNAANWGNSLPSPGLDAPAPVPEPATIVLLLIGLAGLVGAGRWRRG
jgi:hypothetical protein